MSLDRKLDSKQVVKRLVKEHIAPYKAKVLLAIFFMIITALCSAIIVRLVKPAIDDVFVDHNCNMLVALPLIMFGIYLLKGIAEYFQNFLIKCVGQQVLTNMQMLMYRHLLFADFLFIQLHSSGRLISRFTNDIVIMRGAVSNMLVGCAKHFLSVLFLIVVMFSLDPFLSMFIFFTFPIAIIPMQTLSSRMKSVTGKAQEELSHFTAHLDETFHSVKIIKSFCMENIESDRAKKITDKIFGFYKQAAKLDSLTSPVMEILSGLSIACVIWYGGYMVIEGNMTTGGLFAFITAFVSAYRPFKSLVSLNVNLQEGLAAANRVFNILDLKPEVQNVQHALTPKMKRPNIEFQDVVVEFGSKLIINLLNFRVESGKTYAFVGRSGSGKTTIANLLMRLFDPSEGKILINDVHIKQINLKHLRDNIATVTQDILLFDASIADNIAYGSKNASKEDIVKAAKSADAQDFIESLPNGYNTLVGHSGFTLSGGQRQKISIARAFLKNASILLLDEATSALDSNSEQSIINSITNLRKNRTTLIITHRLSSIINVDRILVLEEGKVVEQGTHTNLLKAQKEYFKLYNKELKESPNSV